MQSKFINFLFIVLITALSFNAIAQDIKTVDPKTLPESDIKRAENAIKESGMSVQEAADLARQRGATEQQISDMINRMQGGNNSDGTIENQSPVTEDPVQEAVEELEEQSQNEDQTEQEKSLRSGSFDAGGRIFGSYLFHSDNLTFEPNLNIQTPSNYDIGIGDQILINIWGNSQQNYQLTVNKNGQIIVPDVGPIFLSGMKFEDAENKIINRLTTIYSDMGGNSPETFAQISMGQLRSIQVNLVGEVASPGTYTLPVTASVFNALYLSGGPNQIGSFREIRIIRGDKIHKTVDIYKFLVDADPSDNILLKEGDVIFIPPVKTRVEINGEFKRNGLFEMKEGENLSELIRFAGGFTANSYLSRIQVYRKTQQGSRIIDVSLEEAQNTLLQDGDEVRNKPIIDIFENRVSITGAVTRPGEYEWKEGMLLSDLLEKSDSITADAYLKGGHIIRYNPDLTQRLITFKLNDILQKKSDYVLFPEDIVSIKSHFQMMENNTFSVAGHVMSPGTFPFMDSTTVKDAIYLANGLREGATEFGHVIRVLHDRSYTFINFNVNDVLYGNADFPVKKEDVITVKSNIQLKAIPQVTVAGEVKSPGQFNYMEKMTLRDAIYLANGFTEGADSSYIEIARRLTYEEESQLTDTLVHLFTENLNRELNAENRSFLLQPFDQVFVRRAPGYRNQGSVSITGEVKYAGRFALSVKGQRISDLIKMAGGLTEYSFPEGATFTRSTEELGNEFIAVELQQILRKPGGGNDLYLRNGDQLHVPEQMQTVKVTGSVQNPFSIMYEKGRSLRYYIDKSGGFSSEAMKRKTFVRYPNGATSSTKSFIFKSYPEVMPGSQIVVPAKPEKEGMSTGQWLGIASTFSSIAVAIAAILR